MPRTRKKSYRQKQSARRKKLQLETPEHKALRLEKNRTRAAVRRASENECQREIRLAKDRARQNTIRASRRSTEKSVYNRLKFLENNSTFNELTIKQSLVYERLKAQREAAALRQAERRRQETPEQRAIRLEKDRIRVALSRANESEEARAIRLARQRHQVNAARLRLKYKAQLRSGKVDTINSLQNKPIFDPLHMMIENKFNNLNNGNFIEQSRALAEFHGMYHQLKAYTSLSNYPQIISECGENEKTTFEDYPESDTSPVIPPDSRSQDSNFRRCTKRQEGPELEEISTDETVDCEEEFNYKTAFGTSLPISNIEEEFEVSKNTRSRLCDSLRVKREVLDNECEDEKFLSVERSELIIPSSQHNNSSVNFSSAIGTLSEEHMPSTFEFCSINFPKLEYLKEGLKKEKEENDSS